eukprot:72678-Pleurochrysis_carterae.AAC.1
MIVLVMTRVMVVKGRRRWAVAVRRIVGDTHRQRPVALLHAHLWHLVAATATTEATTAVTAVAVPTTTVLTTTTAAAAAAAAAAPFTRVVVLAHAGEGRRGAAV